MTDHATHRSRVPTWLRRRVEDPLAEAVGGRKRLLVIAVLAGVLGLENADTATIGAIAAPLEASLHISVAQVGLLATASIGVGAIATLPIGVLVDRVNRVRLLVGAIIVWSAAMAVCGLAQSFAMLLVTRLALGAIVATANPVIASLTGDLFLPGERGRVYSTILTGELVGTGVGFLVAGNIAGLAGWRSSFFVLAVPGVALAVFAGRTLHEPVRGGASRLHPVGSARRAHEDAPEEDRLGEDVEAEGVEPDPRLVLKTDPRDMPLRQAVAYVLKLRTNLALVIASGLGYFFFSGLRTFGVELLRGRFGLGQSTASTLLVAVGTGAVVGTLASGRLADRLIGAGRATARPLIAGAAFVAAAAVFVPGLVVTALAIALPVILVAGVAYGATNPPLDAARLDVVQHHLWGRAEAVRTCLRSLLEAAAPLAFGLVAARLGRGQAGFVSAGGARSSAAAARSAAPGLDATFLVMLVPLLGAGLILLVFARRTYTRDVATTLASEHNTSHTDEHHQPSPTG